MTESTSPVSSDALKRCRLPATRRPMRLLTLVAIGGIALALIGAFFVETPWRRFMLAYLVAFAFVLSISLGCMFFVLLQHLTRAGWGVTCRRIAEIFSVNIVCVAILFIPIAWTVIDGRGTIYPWSQASLLQDAATARPSNDSIKSPVIAGWSFAALSTSTRVEVDESADPAVPASHAKPFLTPVRFIAQWIFIFLVWMGIALAYYRWSTSQDSTDAVDPTRRMEWFSGVSVVLFGFTLTFAAFDLLMSLDPGWYSTIFGAYYFAGCAVAAMATILLSILLLRQFALVPNVFSDELQRDLGRLLFAFVFFWAYIAFSQYMLLWYANVPETTAWLVRRGMSTATGHVNSWGWLAIGLLLAHFMVPFAGIMSRHVKSHSKAMIVWTIWLLTMHYLDLYWIVMPELSAELTISFVDIGVVVLVLAVYLMAALWIASRESLFAAGDPRINESLRRQALY